MRCVYVSGHAEDAQPAGGVGRFLSSNDSFFFLAYPYGSEERIFLPPNTKHFFYLFIYLNTVLEGKTKKDIFVGEYDTQGSRVITDLSTN